MVTWPDGTIDTATTDIALIGKGYAGLGEKLNENLVKLLENFNNTAALALGSGKTVGFYPGEFPVSPARVLAQARAGVSQWQEGAFHDQAFAPAPLSLPPGYVPPPIPLDKALTFLFRAVLLA